MGKWTQGPWFIRAERYRFIRVDSTAGAICHMDTIDGEGSANARLIAAAPELVEALRMVVAADAAEDWSRAVDHARAALAKAGVK